MPPRSCIVHRPRWRVENGTVLADLAHVLARWRLPDVSRLGRPELGTMNETWLIHHATGGAVLRRHRSCDLEAVRFEHTVIEHVRRAELPVPALIPSQTGDTVVQQKGRLYTLYSLEPGEHPQRGRAGAARAYAAGEMLGRLHSALASLDGGPDDTGGPGTTQATEHGFDELERAARSGHWPIGSCAISSWEVSSTRCERSPVMTSMRSSARGLRIQRTRSGPSGRAPSYGRAFRGRHEGVAASRTSLHRPLPDGRQRRAFDVN